MVKAYMYSKKSHRFLPIELERIKQLQDEGLVLGSRPKEKGVGLLKRYIKNNEKEAKEI